MFRLRSLSVVALLLAACVSNGTPGPGEGGGGGGLDNVGGQKELGGAGGGSNGQPPEEGFLPDAAGVQTGGADAVCSAAYPATSTFFLSPDDSGSMASPRYVRELLRGGVLPAPERVRAYEFMNYYHFDFPEPDARLGVHGELRRIDDTDEYELLVAVRARSAARPPMGVTFVVDSSASMAGPGIARARRVLTSMIGQLAEGDVINVVRWSSDAEPLVEGQTIHEATKQELAQQVVALLAPYGGSDLTGGLQKGYQVAHDHKVAGGQNTVVLLSDGGASPSPWDLQQVQKEIAAADENDRVHLTGVGVGPAAGYDDALMDAITDAARGSYAYVDDDALTDAVVGDRFDELMFVAEEAIGVSVSLPGYFEITSFSGEEVSTQKELVRDQHIAPGDTVVLRQVLTLRDGCGPSVLGSPAYATSIVAKATSGVGDAYEEIASVDISLAGGGASSFNLTKARLVHAFATALAVTDGEAAVKAALASVLADFETAKTDFGALDEELDDIEETITLYLGA